MPSGGIELATLQLLFCNSTDLGTWQLTCQLRRGMCELMLQSTAHVQYHHQSNFKLMAHQFFKIF